MRYTITVLGQDDPDALRAFLADTAETVAVDDILTAGPALQIIADGPPESIRRLCLELLAAGYATQVTARAHPPVV